MPLDSRGWPPLYPIERGVPLPRTHRGNRHQKHASYALYPWRQMEPGDSFFVPNADYDKRHSIRTAARVAGHKTGFTFVTSSVDGGIRVWRAA